MSIFIDSTRLLVNYVKENATGPNALSDLWFASNNAANFYPILNAVAACLSEKIVIQAEWFNDGSLDEFKILVRSVYLSANTDLQQTQLLELFDRLIVECESVVNLGLGDGSDSVDLLLQFEHEENEDQEVEKEATASA